MRAAVRLLVVTLVSATVSAESLYDVLGVKPTATPAEIRSAYRKLALQLHPDKAKSADSGAAGFADTTSRFIKVSEAYATLSNERKRAQYDASYPRGFSSNVNGDGAAFQFTFSMKDALEVLEAFLRRLEEEGIPGLSKLADAYKAARGQLERWPGFNTPLPQLLANGALLKGAADLAKLVDWSALAETAQRKLAKHFEKDDGSVDWVKVATTTGAGVTALAGLLDKTDDGNRTKTLLQGMSKLASFFGAGSRSGGGSDSSASPPSAPREADEL